MEDDRCRDAQERIRRLPGCEGISVVHEHGEWRAVRTIGVPDGRRVPAQTGTDVLVRRPSLDEVVAFFERRGGFAQEGGSLVP